MDVHSGCTERYVRHPLDRTAFSPKTVCSLPTAEIFSEVWSYSFDNATNKFEVADLARLSGSVESDAIQLWSYGFLGLVDPTSNETAT